MWRRPGERNPGGCAGGRERLHVVHDHAGVDELGALEGGLIARGGIGALEMKVAAVAAHAGVEILIAEVETEAELVAIEDERALQIPDAEYRRNVSQSSLSAVHGGPLAGCLGFFLVTQ
jgi:hypothetical protein